MTILYSRPSRSYFVCVLMFCIGSALGQSRDHIDSLNGIRFDKKIAKLQTLEKTYLKNADASQRLGYLKGEADSYANLALVYYYQGKYGLNVDFALKSIALYEKMGDVARQAKALGELGYMMKRRSLKKALYYMQKGKNLAERHNLVSPLMALYDNYGVLKEMEGHPDSAMYFYQKSLKLKEEQRDSIGIPYSLNNIAGIHLLKREFTSALPHYQRALAIRQKLRDKIGMAETYLSLGEYHQAMQQHEVALGFYQKALALSAEPQYLHLMKTCYKQMASAYEHLGQHTEALRSFKEHSRLKDSLLNKETNSRIAELEVQFDTAQKEKLLVQKEAEVASRSMMITILLLVVFATALISFLVYRQQKMHARQLTQEHELKSAIGQIETQNKLQEQRLQISRDLHDNIGSQLTFIISSVDNIRYAFDTGNGKLGSKLNSISDFARETIVELRDTIWAMNNSDIGFDDLQSRITNFIEKAGDSHEHVTFDFQLDQALSEVRFSSVVGINIHRTIQEAVHNALKYSGASEISIFIRPEGEQIAIIVDDNGSGFDVTTIERGHGLYNMEKRMNELGGTLAIDSRLGAGTRIDIRLDRNKINLQTPIA